MTADLDDLWAAVTQYDGARPKSFDLPWGRAQLYMGAMEIPMVALRPKGRAATDDDRIQGWASALAGFGLELDCVEVGENYKVNRSDTKEYVGRVTSDALKLHVGRIAEIGHEAFKAIVDLYLRLPGES
jgi:hypothetical protein